MAKMPNPPPTSRCTHGGLKSCAECYHYGRSWFLGQKPVGPPNERVAPAAGGALLLLPAISILALTCVMFGMKVWELWHR